MSKLKIGELAESLGLTTRTLRYYEEIGLLVPRARKDGCSGPRLYDEQDRQRLERIRNLKDVLGFNLNDIRKILEAEDRLERLWEDYRASTDREQKRADLQQIVQTLEAQKALAGERLRQLAEMQRQLEEKLGRCRKTLAELEKEGANRR